MERKDKIVLFSVEHYKLVTWIMILFTVVCGAMIPLIKVDTDPENMLAADEPVRVFHNQTKKQFDLRDMVIVGIINEHHENGVFNPDTLRRIYELTEFAKTLHWDDPEHEGRQMGVIEVDMIAPSLIDHIEGGGGVINFQWLMPRPPRTQAEALEIRDQVLSNQLLRGTMVSEDGRALMLLMPLTDKYLSYRVYSELNKKIAEFDGDEVFHITGLPVAEDTFGVEMFIQMAISAPLAMLTIFILMLLFFRKLVLVISPMIIAMVSVITTMGLLIGFGFPVHIMSSMIPIFLMPIAVVDSVHILSEFFDRYTPQKGRKESIVEVVHTLFVPMLYTSLTSAAGFLSLALTPIPPVQVFGVYVAIGIMIAWIFTVMFVPAYVMMIPDRALAGFGMAAQHEERQTWLTRVLRRTGRMTSRGAWPIAAVLIGVTAAAVYGITKIRINDNPVKWFSKSHPIRQADIALNKHFGGTYMAYLVLSTEAESKDVLSYVPQIQIAAVRQKTQEIQEEYPKAQEAADQIIDILSSESFVSIGQWQDRLKRFSEIADEKMDAIPETDDALFYAWDVMANFVKDEVLQNSFYEPFKDPEVLNYMFGLQKHLEESGLVGKSNSLANIVMKVHQELTDGSEANYRIPDSKKMVAECLIQYQNSHRPQDLWHMVTSDMMGAAIWMQLTSGDNQDMERVVEAANSYIEDHPPPVFLEHQWAGLTYINIIWQDKMVWGMLQSFLGSFLVVFIMMSLLFRSPLWGLICMVPLTITIVVIYGIIGLVGKDYDMPVAVLSALTLGMAVDFAIHFLQRSRDLYAQDKPWEKVAGEMFGEPARAISRNVLVIAIGFLPLLAAPLIPYKTVGIFLCAIMALSGIVTLLALPALLKLGEKAFFRAKAPPAGATCNCGFCIVISTAIVVLVTLNLHQYWHMGATKLTWISVVLIPILALTCGILSRRRACRIREEKKIS